MNINKELCERLGIEWHECEICPHCGYLCHGRIKYCTPHLPNYDFTTDAGKIQLLRKIKKREDYHLFLKKIYVDATTPEEILDRSIIQLFDDRKGKLAEVVLDWLKKTEEGKAGRIERREINDNPLERNSWKRNQ